MELVAKCFPHSVQACFCRLELASRDRPSDWWRESTVKDLMEEEGGRREDMEKDLMEGEGGRREDMEKDLMEGEGGEGDGEMGGGGMEDKEDLGELLLAAEWPDDRLRSRASSSLLSQHPTSSLSQPLLSSSSLPQPLSSSSLPPSSSIVLAALRSSRPHRKLDIR